MASEARQIADAAYARWHAGGILSGDDIEFDEISTLAAEMGIAEGSRRATAAIVQLADALEWALREIDEENEYRKGHQQIQCRQNAEAVLALWKCGDSGKVGATTAKTAEYERAIVGEGMRRERKAIVKWLQSDVSQLGFLGFQAADAIERGDHITEAKP